MTLSTTPSAQRPLLARRWSRGRASFGPHRISWFRCLPSCPTRSPASPLAGNIGSLPGQVTLAQPCLRDGAHALHIRHVRAKPVVALRPPTHLTVLARDTCASRRPLWSPMLILLHTLITRLIGNELEPPCDDLAHPGRLPCDAAVWQDTWVVWGTVCPQGGRPGIPHTMWRQFPRSPLLIRPQIAAQKTHGFEEPRFAPCFFFFESAREHSGALA